MKSFETSGGKRIDMFIDPKTTNIKIQFNPGGQMPLELSGVFTSEKEAENAILIYLSKKH